MEIDDAVERALNRADLLVGGEREQLMLVFDVDGDVTAFEFETPRFTCEMVRLTGRLIGYLHPDVVVLVTRRFNDLALAARKHDGQSVWMLVPIEGGGLGTPTCLDRELFTAVDRLWEGVHGDE